MKRLDIQIGAVYSYLTVIKTIRAYKYGSIRPRLLYFCRCKCGKSNNVRATELIRATTRSCGCLQKQIVSKISRERNTTHGLSISPTYKIWIGMKTRCNNEKRKDFIYYGGRGIKVSKRWDSFENFLHDMGERPNTTMTIDRIDTNGHYCAKNCRWVDRKTQSQNRRAMGGFSKKRVT